MNITPEEKKHLIEQIENLTSISPLFYLKFCSCESFAQDICNGDLYANTAEFFRQKEIETGERGQGDRFELQLSIQAENITAFDSETGHLVFTAPNSTFNVHFKEDDEIPLISLVGIPLGDMDILEVDESHTTFKFPFSNEEYDTMTERFGKYCVIIGGVELRNKIDISSKQSQYEYIFDQIEYCDQNRIDRIEAFNKSDKKRFLYKNCDLEYQREYRLALAIEMPEDHFIRLGKFADAHIVKAEKLKDLAFVINYKSHPK